MFESARLPRSVTESISKKGVLVGNHVSLGDGATLGYRTLIGDGVEYEHGDWLFVAGPHGPSGYWVTAVWSPKNDLRW